MKFTKKVGKEILTSWNYERHERFELPGGNELVIGPREGFYIRVNGKLYLGNEIIELANGLRFVLNDGTTRTYLYNSEEE